MINYLERSDEEKALDDFFGVTKEEREARTLINRYESWFSFCERSGHNPF